MTRARYRAGLTILAATLVLTGPAPSGAQPSLAFIGVALDRDTRDADRRLIDYLYQHAGVRLAPEDLEYERVVDRLVKWQPKDGAFVARATPYVYLAAEMQGAELDVLATYVSTASNRTTYSSFFVVNRADFTTQPTLLDVERFLRDRRRRFIYHNQFSTSSYFLPSLFFRARKIFNMPESSESLVAIAAERAAEASSTELVERVANRQADIAAVWDATKNRFTTDEAYRAAGEKVWFVQLPTRLPNDLLVCSASLDRAVKEKLQTAVRQMKPDEIRVADFRTWQVITDATEARLALADLRWIARERPAPVTVQIKIAAADESTPRGSALMEAARQAVRLSGTELVVFDEDFHEHRDIVWTLEAIHDGAVLVRSAIPGAELPDQVLRLSYRDVEDLSKRLATMVASRLHRIRYVWAFSAKEPTVIRDMSLSLPAGSVVKVQKVTWLDPERNRFRAGSVFDVRVKASGFYRYELDARDFQIASEQSSGYDAMSNVAYRVILVRPQEERQIFRILTIVLLVTIIGIAVAAVVDLRRRRPVPRSDPQWI